MGAVSAVFCDAGHLKAGIKGRPLVYQAGAPDHEPLTPVSSGMGMLIARCSRFQVFNFADNRSSFSAGWPRPRTTRLGRAALVSLSRNYRRATFHETSTWARENGGKKSVATVITDGRTVAVETSTFSTRRRGVLGNDDRGNKIGRRRCRRRTRTLAALEGPGRSRSKQLSADSGCLDELNGSGGW